VSYKNNRSTEWELTRSRFYISDPFPPKPLRKEKDIGAILSGIIQKEAPPEADLPEELTSRWPLVVGQHISKHTEPAYLKMEILHVYADHPGWLSEIRRLPKSLLLKKLAAIPQLSAIKDIRFQLDPAIQTWKNRT